MRNEVSIPWATPKGLVTNHGKFQFISSLDSAKKTIKDRIKDKKDKKDSKLRTLKVMQTEG